MNAMTYGQLGYVLLVATAGTSMTVLAIRVSEPRDMYVLQEITEVRFIYSLTPRK